MLDTHAEGKALGLQLDTLGVEHLINVAGGVACGQDDGPGAESPAVGRADAHAVLLLLHVADTGSEVVLPSVLHDSLADVFDHGRELVCTDVRMRINQYLGRGSELHETIEHLAVVTPLGRAGIEFSVGECACSTFAEAVVGVRIEDALSGETCHIRLAGVHVLAALQHHGLEPEAQELERGEHPCGASTDDDHRRSVVDVEELRQPVGLISLVRPIDLNAIAPYGLSAGVDAPARDHAG